MATNEERSEDLLRKLVQVAGDLLESAYEIGERAVNEAREMLESRLAHFGDPADEAPASPEPPSSAKKAAPAKKAAAKKAAVKKAAPAKKAAAKKAPAKKAAARPSAGA